MVMMIGEFDFENLFIMDSVKEGGGSISTQVLFILLLVFVCIVIANLLVIAFIAKCFFITFLKSFLMLALLRRASF